MLTAESEIMCLFVSATKDSSEIPSRAATDQQQPRQDQKLLILADQVLVASMLSAEKEMELPPAPVTQVSRAIPMWSADTSAPLTPSVPHTWPASVTSVATRAQECVAPTPPAPSTTTTPPAPATRDTPGIPSPTA